MDALLQALTAGATAFASAGATAAGRDVYDRLVSVVRDRVGGDRDAAAVDGALSLLEERPDSSPRQAVLGELLDESGVAEDPDVAALARRLLDTLEATPAAGEIQQTATGHNVIQQVGDNRAAIVDRSRRRR